MVANATALASSYCSYSGRYSLDMDIEAVQEHRRARLAAAAKKVGGKAELGRLLGYKDGAYVGQMLRGDRTISEKTVAELEAKHGFRNWFAEQAPVEEDEEMALSERQREFLRALEFLSESGQEQALRDVQMRVAQEVAKGLMEGTLQMKGLASDKKVEGAYGTPPNNVQPLPAESKPLDGPSQVPSPRQDAARPPQAKKRGGQ